MPPPPAPGSRHPPSNGSPKPVAPSTDLTWPGLLAHWTAFARSSVALPKNSEGERWRAAVAPIIALQAVTFALGDLGRLGKGEDRALALDKAEIIVRGQSGTLHALWRGEALHEELVTLIHDAHAALEAARAQGEN